MTWTDRTIISSVRLGLKTSNVVVARLDRATQYTQRL
jgi:hypothetical protein